MFCVVYNAHSCIEARLVLMYKLYIYNIYLVLNVCKKKLIVQNESISAYYNFLSLHKSLTKTALQEKHFFYFKKLCYWSK